MTKNIKYYMGLNYKIEIDPISKEDGGGWLAVIPELEGCMADGETPSEASENIIDAKQDWITFCLDEGLDIPEPMPEDVVKYSGKFTLRVGKTIHRELVETAKKEDISLNSLVNGFIHTGLRTKNITKELKDLISSNIKPEFKIYMNNKRTTPDHKIPVDKNQFVPPWEARFQSNHFYPTKGLELDFAIE